MGTVYKTDVDAQAATYLKNRALSYGAYERGNTPNYVNQSPLGTLDRNPSAAYPSRSLSGPIAAAPLKSLMIQLVAVYAHFGNGTYGLHYTETTWNDETDSWRSVTGVKNGGTAKFVFSASNGAVGEISGRAFPLDDPRVILYHVQDFYNHGWIALMNHANDINMDLTVCHSSCHQSCHGSRGRR